MCNSITKILDKIIYNVTVGRDGLHSVLARIVIQGVRQHTLGVIMLVSKHPLGIYCDHPVAKQQYDACSDPLCC